MRTILELHITPKGQAVALSNDGRAYTYDNGKDEWLSLPELPQAGFSASSTTAAEAGKARAEAMTSPILAMLEKLQTMLPGSFGAGLGMGMGGDGPTPMPLIGDPVCTVYQDETDTVCGRPAVLLTSDGLLPRCVVHAAWKPSSEEVTKVSPPGADNV